MFSEKNIMNLSSAKSAQDMVKVKKPKRIILKKASLCRLKALITTAADLILINLFSQILYYSFFRENKLFFI